MPNVNYFSEDVDFSLKNQNSTTVWISNVITSNNYEVGEINYIFCSDSYLLNINQQYLNHDTYTDIITFDNSSVEFQIESDIYISVDRVIENAKEYELPFEKELHRVMIHGVLHLLGWGDITTDEKRRMREKEDACLSLFSISN